MNQAIVFFTLGLALILFAWGKIRHDFVALIALFIVTVTGVISSIEAFEGFGHPAVITVASVLIIGRALQRSGLADLLSQLVARIGSNFLLQITLLCTITAVISSFMNNVGALAVMMPVALQIAAQGNHSPSSLLMPIAFASLLGGMTTLIGTPPNVIIATIRADITGEAFGMFQFTPVGFFVMAAGLAFVALIGWRLLPVRSPQNSDQDIFHIDDYITELQIPPESKLVGITIAQIRDISKTDITLLGIVRQKRRIHAPAPDEELLENDILIIETDTEDLKKFIDNSGAVLLGGKKFRMDARGSTEIVLAEAVIMNDSPLIGQSAASLRMRTRYNLNLLAISRRETKLRKRLDRVIFKAGDVVLLQGRRHMLFDMINTMKCLPLAKRTLDIGNQRKLFLSLGIFSASILLVVSGLLPVQVAFSMAAVAFVLTGLLPLGDFYTAVDWPVIVLLGAMIPVGQALETTGGATFIASQILRLGENLPGWAMLTIIFIITMFLSDIINNAATVVLMAPIGISVAVGINVSVDPFLMAVAIGGSCAFLTPIGHQSNTLVMGPGGYKFTDYWRMGLPLDILIVLIGIPLLLFFWPL
jgi:di/tricarboxylate transporter